jgi:hypothetical protein
MVKDNMFLFFCLYNDRQGPIKNHQTIFSYLLIFILLFNNLYLKHNLVLKICVNSLP